MRVGVVGVRPGPLRGWSRRRGLVAGGVGCPRRRGVARDLVASLDRFNRRWAQFLPIIDLKPLNVAIEQYNRYYVFEKECAMGSARLAAQHFQPIHAWSLEQLWSEFPLIEPLALRK